MNGNDRSRDDRLLEIARRLLDGEKIDWDREELVEADVRDGMMRLERVLARLADAAPPEPSAPSAPPPSSGPRDEGYIGDFRLVRKLGEGGMGVVYEAEQQHPRRPVALKVIRGGTHVSRDSLKLFRREIQTLARLRHPAIAALYETGATEDGMHYFAMELVRGSTLSTWIGNRPPGPVSPDELNLRLRVFGKICDAVAYAHQKGVIHRDLKPVNVLVREPSAGSSIQDPAPDVKVLDFGLARITDSDLQATTYVTEMGKVQGTLPYMSPEQVRGIPDEIDLRTDVYSLGVILYEMVTGHLPYDLSKAHIPEAIRIICEDAPASISATFSGTRRLDADVITIAGKCLEKEASRRYQSAAALGEDIRRYLSDQPILARPPSAAYQLRKLVARHKGVFALAGAAFVLVTALAITSTVEAVRIARERDRANQEAETSRRVSEFLEGLFKISDPSEARGKSITARELLDAGAQRIETELADEPEVRARLMSIIGHTYTALYLVDPARRVLRRSLELHEATFGSTSPEFAEALNAVGGVEQIAGDISTALEYHRRAAEIYRELLPEDDVRRLRGEWQVAALQAMQGDPRGALPALRHGIEVLERSERPDERLLSFYMRDLGLTYVALGDLEEARANLQRVVEIQRRILGPTHPEYLASLNNLGFLLTMLGETGAARPYLEEAVRGREAVFGPRHVTTANAIHSLGELEHREGREERAAADFERALSIQEESLGPRAPDVAMTLTSLGRVRLAEERYPEARAVLERAIEIYTAARGPDSVAQVEPLEALAEVMRALGDPATATRLEDKARVLRSRSGVQGVTTGSTLAPPGE